MKEFVTQLLIVIPSGAVLMIAMSYLAVKFGLIKVHGAPKWLRPWF